MGLDGVSNKSGNINSYKGLRYSTGQKYGLIFFFVFKTAVEIGPVG